MAPSSVFLSTLAAILPLTIASSLANRQANFPWQYVTRLNTALEALDSIKANTAFEGCADPNYVASMEMGGYDGEFAKTLLCEEAAGIDVFPDIDNAEREFQAALDGLLFISDNGDGPEYCRTHTVDVDALDNAGLQGEAIRDFLCHRAKDSTMGTSSIAVSATPLPLNTSVTQSGTQPGSPSTISQSFAPTQQSSSTQNISATLVSTSSLIPSSGQSTPSNSTSLRFDTVSSVSILAPTGPTGPAGSPVSSSAQPPPSSVASPASFSNTDPTTSAGNNVPVVVITAFTTVTVTPTAGPTPSAAFNGNGSTNGTDSRGLPPLRFTLASRVDPEQPVITTTSSATSVQMTWTIGPPLSFPDPHLGGGTVTTTSVAVVAGRGDDMY